MVIIHDADQFEEEKVALKDSKYIGEVHLKIQQLVCSLKKEVEMPLHNQKGEGAGTKGYVKISYDEDLCCTNQDLMLVISLFEGDFITENSYFMEIHKLNQLKPSASVAIFRTEKLMYNSETSVPFRKINIPVDCLLSSKGTDISIHDIGIKLIIKQYNSQGTHSVVCEIQTNVGNLINGDSLMNLTPLNNDLSYSIKINKCQLKRTPSFLDYINNGCEMNLIAGIDFTGSNLNGMNGENLHSPDFSNNQYYNAIQKISNILLNFDSDKQVPLFGFGAMIDERYYQQVSHCFALNGNAFRPEVDNLQGIETTYRNAMNNIMFAGPTYFSPLLKEWNEMVKFESDTNPKKYYVYLILTDGMIHDINDTVEQIVISTQLPISVIIIGIGNADFSNMVFLDSDTQPLFCQNTQTFSKRDNVQFVKFNDYKDNLEKLATETLMELPRQMIDYFESIGITPEDMSVHDENLEARDYSSQKAMKFISNETIFTQLSPERTQVILQEGIADPQNINMNALIEVYQNKLKI